jgi:phosphohistidine phosphatase
MKQVFLLRHGKSDWDSGFSSDHERPLAPRGERSARLVGSFLTALGNIPGAVISSSAVRALTTAQLAKESGGWAAEIEVTPDLYQAVPSVLLEHVRQTSEDVERLLLVGHEPTWSETVGLLVGQAEVQMVTAALARVDFPLSRWGDVRFGTGMLAWLVTPKILAAASQAG